MKFCKPAGNSGKIAALLEDFSRSRDSEEESQPTAISESQQSESREESWKKEKSVPVDLVKRDDDAARLEAVLFLAREPLGSRKLAQFADISEGARIRPLIRELNRKYDEQPCAFRVVEVAGGFQLRTRSQFAPWLVRLHEVPLTIRLSGTVLETLAVVAYKQPVLRAVVESIRGVQCGEILRQLMEKNLVKIVGRSEELGRPFLYGTTKYFLQVFGLNRIEELPVGKAKKRESSESGGDFSESE